MLGAVLELEGTSAKYESAFPCNKAGLVSGKASTFMKKLILLSFSYVLLFSLPERSLEFLQNTRISMGACAAI
jgi:hypothetical protein